MKNEAIAALIISTFSIGNADITLTLVAGYPAAFYRNRDLTIKNLDNSLDNSQLDSHFNSSSIVN
jgi:ABC-type spermidine/putrescine transport system permease subunit I